MQVRSFLPFTYFGARGVEVSRLQAQREDDKMTKAKVCLRFQEGNPPFFLSVFFWGGVGGGLRESKGKAVFCFGLL